MSQQRINLGFGDDLSDFDPSEWQPEPKPKPKRQETRKSAEAAGFKSREPEATKPVKAAQQRGRRTGRNAQFNIKAKPETIEAFCAVADGQGWGLGETLEYAVELLEKQYANKR